MAIKTYVITGMPRWYPIVWPYSVVTDLDSVGDERDLDLAPTDEAALLGSGVLTVKVIPHLRLY